MAGNFFPILQVISTITGAISAISGSRASGAAYEETARLQAEEAARRQELAAKDEEELRKHMRRQAATRRALLAGSGVKGGTGSPLLAAEDFEREVEQEALKIRAGGEADYTRLMGQAGLSRMRAGHARTAAAFGAGKTLLTEFREAFV